MLLANKNSRYLDNRVGYGVLMLLDLIENLLFLVIKERFL